MIVYKFGGTSLADAGRIRHAAHIVRESEQAPAVVVSALSGVTNRLVELASVAAGGDREGTAAILEELAERHRGVATELFPPSPERVRVLRRIDDILGRLTGLCQDAARAGDGSRRLVDEISAVGEDLSVELMAGALEMEGLRARIVDARTVVRTDDRYGSAIPRDEDTADLVRSVLGAVVERGDVPVLQGFVGATDDGRTTTLGRGGSDFTAAIVGAALSATDVAIWTDVDGVMSADPRVVPGARVLPELGYEEAVELAYFGARAIHPAAAKHAAARDLSLRVRNSFKPEAQGTLIRADRARAAGVAAVACKLGVTLIKVRSRPMFMAYGFLARTFEVLARHRLPVDLVATSHTSTAFTIDESEGLAAVRSDLGVFAEVEVVPGVATISVVGHGLLQRPGISARVFSALGTTPVELISQASDVSLSFLVGADAAEAVVRRLHRDLIERA